VYTNGVIGGNATRYFAELSNPKLILGGYTKLVFRQRLQVINNKLQRCDWLPSDLLPANPVAHRGHVTALEMVPGYRGVALVRRKLVRQRAPGTRHVADSRSRRRTGNSCNRNHKRKKTFFNVFFKFWSRFLKNFYLNVVYIYGADPLTNNGKCGENQ